LAKPISKRGFKSFLGMMLAGALGGFITAILGILIGAGISNGNSSGGFGDLVGAIVGMIVGYTVGVVLGLAAFSKVFSYRGSIWLAAFGAASGMFIVLGLAEPLNLNSNSDLMLGSVFLTTSLLATWGFHIKKV